MLVLSRRKNEEIHIGNDVTITIVEIRGDKVRLGIDAPEEVSVDRREVRLAKQAARLDDHSTTEETSHDRPPSQHAA